MRKKISLATMASTSVLALMVASAPHFAGAADHLDAPGLMPPSARADADITDIYAFQARNSHRTVLILDTHPGAGVIAPADYASDVNYTLNLDRNGDARADLAYNVRFGKGKGTGHGQRYVITKYTGWHARNLSDGKVIAKGWTGSRTWGKEGTRAYAGTRSDPFFFDLAAFQGAVLGAPNNRTFCDQPGGKGVDFFAPLNVNAIVIEVPDWRLGEHIGYWATTSDKSGRIDRMGRPAINTVFNKGADKNAFNQGNPKDDYANFSGNVIHVLEALGGYNETQATGLAKVLLPDVLTYDTSTKAAGPLNGRALADDVIDAELGIVTNGGVKSDCVSAHTDYESTFPYLGDAH